MGVGAGVEIGVWGFVERGYVMDVNTPRRNRLGAAVIGIVLVHD